MDVVEVGDVYVVFGVGIWVWDYYGGFEFVVVVVGKDGVVVGVEEGVVF